MRWISLTLYLILAGAATAAAQVQPDPGIPLASGSAVPRSVGKVPPVTQQAAGCLESRHGSYAIPAIEYEGRRFQPRGSPEPILAENLDPLGDHGGVLLFTGRLAVRPVEDLWVPVCAPTDHYQLYTRLLSRAGPAGS